MEILLVNPEQEADKVNQNKNTRFHTVANAWLRNKFSSFPNDNCQDFNDNLQDFPIKCFWILIRNEDLIK